ncbi:hypothetical protein D9M68_322600 [compost metagenome]|nr:hypothetical protein N184_25365 [Sinorhizobium sp. GL28]
MIPRGQCEDRMKAKIGLPARRMTRQDPKLIWKLFHRDKRPAQANQGPGNEVGLR